MGNYGRGQVGVGDDLTRVPNRIHLQSTFRGWRKTDPITHGPRPRSGARGGNYSPAGKAGNCRGIGRGGTPLPVLSFSNKKMGQILASHPTVNLKTLNKNCIDAKRFCMETLNLILPLLRKGIWAASVDLQDAYRYLHIPIHRHHQRYLGFQYAGREFTFRALPFSLSTAPRAFTRVAGTVISHVRKRGVMLYAYLDDWLIVGESESNASDNVQKTVQTLRSQSLRTEDRSRNDHSPNPITTRVIDRDVAPSPRGDGQPGRRGAIMQTTHAPAATSPAKDDQPTKPRQDSADPPVGKEHTSPAMVARHGELGPKGSLHRESANDIGHDGCLTDRVGSPLEQPNSLEDVVPSGENMAYQLTRDVGCQTGPRVVPRERAEHSNHRLHRQYHRSSIHKQTGGHPLQETMSAGLGSPNDSQGLRHDISSIPYRRQTECDGRCPVQRTDGPNEWALSQETCNRIFKVLGRPVCDGGECQTSDLLLQTVPPQGTPHRRHVFPMGLSGSLRLPAALHDRPGAEKKPTVQGESHTGSPILASQTMVQGNPTTPNGHPSDPTGHTQSAVPKTGDPQPPRHQGLQLVAWKLSGLPSDRGVFRRRLPLWQLTPGEHQPCQLTIPYYENSGNGARTDRYCQPRPLWHKW
ncbi:putative TBC1 domain family member 2A [Apostichopus japonicus]|uniref:Putative TBC1 domain family member 2A n=1 Tax=Stichopus japonicus TaxID=307972 RepID=A0A2G8JI89_STIJA|nr:putative TBC1 domain family member 2A [Apostichopus japonicus]